MISKFLPIKRAQYVDSEYGIVIRRDVKNKRLYVRDLNDEFHNQEELLKAVSYELATRIKRRFKINLIEYGVAIRSC